MECLAIEIVGTLTVLKYIERLFFLRKLLICNFIFLLLLIFVIIYCTFMHIFLYMLLSTLEYV